MNRFLALTLLLLMHGSVVNASESPFFAPTLSKRCGCCWKQPRSSYDPRRGGGGGLVQSKTQRVLSLARGGSDMLLDVLVDQATTTATTALPAAAAAAAAAAADLLSQAPIEYSGEVSALTDDAYAWCMNLGQPSALVAGAVIATIYENIGSGFLDIHPHDSRLTKLKKRVTGSLLLSAFGFEVIAIFVTTVTGTMLLSRPLHDMDHLVPIQEHTTPLEFLRQNFEFEYLTARISFLQGLLNWLASIALGHMIPREGESQETSIMNHFISNALFCTVAIMVAFYNQHMSFYVNYAEMLSHWVRVAWKKYVWSWPPQPMAFVYIPLIFSTLYWFYQGFIKGNNAATVISTSQQDQPMAKQQDDDITKQSSTGYYDQSHRAAHKFLRMMFTR